MSKYTLKQPELPISLMLVGIIALSSFISHGRVSVHQAAPAELENSTCLGTCGKEVVNHEPTFEVEQMQKRLQKNTGRYFSVTTLENALQKRDVLLQRSVNVQVADSDAAHTAEWKLSLSQYPWLAEFTPTYTGATYDIAAANIKQALVDGVFPGSASVHDVSIVSIKEGKNVTRAEVTGRASDGFEYTDEAAEQITQALLSNSTGSVLVTVPYRDATVTVQDENGTRKLTLLSIGHSTFEDSTPEREWNVHKAFNEKVHNTFVKPDGVFSLNGTLDTPVTLEKGWKEALGLFGGGVAKTPGGGICQAATTAYRAALLAGLPIVERRPHSLYVSHYESYGVGVDATIFPGVHDMRFRNDTSDVLLIQAYTEGIDAYVKIYGIDDGRSVKMQGPYFAHTRPRPAELRALGPNEIGWLHYLSQADGTEVIKPIISHYAKPIPARSLSAKYPPSIMTELPAIPELETL